MRKFKLTKYEQKIEDAIGRGEYVPVSPARAKWIAAQISAYRKDAVISLRINSNDLELIKEKAKKSGVPYQTYITTILHHVVH